MFRFSMARRLVLLLACLAAAPRGARAQPLRIVNATVVDVATGALLRGSTIVIQGNRIGSVGPTARDTSGRIVDAKGAYVIPGLWDMHTHAFFGERTPESRDLILPLFVANGVTGIRDMGSALEPVLRARPCRGAPAARAADDRVGADARRAEGIVSGIDRDHDTGCRPI